MAGREEPEIAFAPVAGWRDALACRHDWDALARGTSVWLPFQEPLWSEVWWRHWAQSGVRRRDRFLLWLGRDAEGAVLAALPTVLTERPGRGVPRLRVLRPLGPDPNLTELQPILCRPEATEVAHAGLVRALFGIRHEWDVFRFSAVPSGVAGALRATGGIDHTGHVPDYVLAIRDGWEAFHAGLPRNVKEAIRKAFNAPKRSGVDLEFSVTGSAEEVRRILPEFLRLHSARASVEEGPPHPDAFVRPEARAFLADLARCWAPAGVLRVFSLRHLGRVVACRIAWLRGDSVYFYYSGYDPAYARYSVGTRTLTEGLRWALDQGVRQVNLSTGTDVAKTRWRPACLEYERLSLWSPSSRGRIVRVLARLLGRAGGG